MKVFNLKIITMSGVIFADEEVCELSVTTSSGQVTILPDHIPLISVVLSGQVTISLPHDHKKIFTTSSGVLEVRPHNEVILLVDEARGE